MPKSFLFTRHKRYEYNEFQEERKTTTTIPSKKLLPIIMPIKVPIIKSERSEVKKVTLMPSWVVSPSTLTSTLPPQKVETNLQNEHEEEMEYFDHSHQGKFEKYTRLKIPALVPVRSNNWNSVLTECAFRVYDHQGNAKDAAAAATDRSVPISLEHEQEDDQPVNLSVKKVDLFNLNRLAEVSLATAEGRSFSSSRNSSSPITIYTSSSPKPICPTLITTIKNNEDYEMGDLRICESPIPNDIKRITTKTTTAILKTEIPIEIITNSEIADSSSSSVEVTTTTNCLEINANINSNKTSHKCLECGKGFSTLSNLARHRQTHRSLSDSSAVKKCPHCDKVYVSMPAFSMHLRTHNQGCKCPYCSKGFSRPWLLQGHIRTHTGEKPFKCPICAKAFADKSNLRAHTQTHSSEKPFICNRCGKPFALKSYLCKHIESSCKKTSRSSSEKTSSSSKSSSSIADHAGTGGDSSCSSFSPEEEGSNDNDSS